MRCDVEKRNEAEGKERTKGGFLKGEEIEIFLASNLFTNVSFLFIVVWISSISEIVLKSRIILRGQFCKWRKGIRFCLPGQEMGFHLSVKSVIPQPSQCPFVGVFNGVFNLIVSEEDPYHTGMSTWSCLPSHSPHLPEASWNCWLIVTQWQQHGSLMETSVWREERSLREKLEHGFKCVMMHQGIHILWTMNPAALADTRDSTGSSTMAKTFFTGMFLGVR